MFRLYCARLAFRIALFIAAVRLYIRDQNSLIISKGFSFANGVKPVHILWLILLTGMVQKFFPQKITSMGCRKQFKSTYAPSEGNFIKSGIAAWVKEEDAAAIKVFIVWFGGNSVVAILYRTGILNESALVLLSLFYYVCDLVCVLFYCPLQSLIMKNRCCVTCRIFNWDSIMILTPLIFVRSIFSGSLVLIALILLIRWEATYRKSPQRFWEESNINLQCRHCHEKTCRIKRRVQYRSSVFRNG